ncbi:hypothetical protein LEMLEM_LOCUS14302 [Lemmus lemmus]
MKPTPRKSRAKNSRGGAGGKRVTQAGALLSGCASGLRASAACGPAREAALCSHPAPGAARRLGARRAGGRGAAGGDERWGCAGRARAPRASPELELRVARAEIKKLAVRLLGSTQRCCGPGLAVVSNEFLLQMFFRAGLCPPLLLLLLLLLQKLTLSPNWSKCAWQTRLAPGFALHLLPSIHSVLPLQAFAQESPALLDVQQQGCVAAVMGLCCYWTSAGSLARPKLISLNSLSTLPRPQNAFCADLSTLLIPSELRCMGSLQGDSPVKNFLPQ